MDILQWLFRPFILGTPLIGWIIAAVIIGWFVVKRFLTHEKSEDQERREYPQPRKSTTTQVQPGQRTTTATSSAGQAAATASDKSTGKVPYAGIILIVALVVGTWLVIRWARSDSSEGSMPKPAIVTMADSTQALDAQVIKTVNRRSPEADLFFNLTVQMVTVTQTDIMVQVMWIREHARNEAASVSTETFLLDNYGNKLMVTGTEGQVQRNQSRALGLAQPLYTTLVFARPQGQKNPERVSLYLFDLPQWGHCFTVKDILLK